MFREEIDGNAVLFRPDTGESFMLNPTAAFLWKEFARGKTETEAFEALKVACGGELPREAPRELRDFILELEKQGYLVERE